MSARCGRLVVSALAALLSSGCAATVQGRATCSDGRVNGNETDLDCGGANCVPCAGGKVCLAHADCQSLQCTGYRCEAPSCSDAIRNAGETDVDCGGGSCGGCDDGKACVHKEDCKSDACSDGTCGSACPAPTITCNGACVDPRVDPNHCGACAVACASGQVCAVGQCAAVCPGGSQKCGAGCVDPASNPAHCGACSRACLPDEVCLGGMCLLPCPVGQLPCGGACVSLDIDPLHCGACSVVCQPGKACVAGQCTAQCQPPLLGCSMGPACVDPRNDPGHCGGCATPCPPPAHAVPACSNSVCVLGPCQPGFENCDGLAVSGCEANLAIDPANCGGCSRACAAAESCLFGRCCGPLPVGSYQQSCVGCEACGGLLTCLCKDAAQVLQPAAIPLGPCAGGYTNCNGVLLCAGC